MIEDLELARLLNLYPILQELPPRLQHSFYDSVYIIRLKEGEEIFDTLHPIQYFLFLISGSVRVVYQGQEREILLYRVQPGQICILWVCQLLGGVPYYARAVTEKPVTGVAIPPVVFTQFLEGSPLFCTYLFRSFSESVVDLLSLVEAVSFNRLDQRLARLLLSKERTILATHSQLADELGSVREVISRILKDFERRGLVKLERGKVKILNRPALETIAASNGDSNHH